MRELIKNDHKSFQTTFCGFVLTGNKSKRDLMLKLHRKKCDICKKSYFDTEIPEDKVDIKKQNYKDYIKGKYSHYLVNTILLEEK